MIYHVLNRRAGRGTLFAHEGDYLAFLRTLRQANVREAEAGRARVGVFSLCLMPNHWHLLVRPDLDGQLSQWMRWLQVTHTQRYHAAHGTAGEGPVYQGRFKSFAVNEPEGAREIERGQESPRRGVSGLPSDLHAATPDPVRAAGPILTADDFDPANTRDFQEVAAYVEGNAARAGLVGDAADWPWGSLGMRRAYGETVGGLLTPPPVSWPVDWADVVNDKAEGVRVGQKGSGVAAAGHVRFAKRVPRGDS